LILGFFWFGGSVQIILYVFSFILFMTGILGFCGIYTLLGINSCRKDAKISRISWIVFILAFLLIGAIGSYASIFFTNKFFLEDYNRMNNYYKQTLFNTGKELRPESISNYDSLISEYEIFFAKYTKYHPYALK